MSNVLTTIVVNYAGNSADNTQVNYEADPAKNVDDAGEPMSGFTEKDDFYFLLSKTGPGIIDKVLSSAGGITYLGLVDQDREDVLDFVELNSKDNKPSLSYKPITPLSKYWVGVINKDAPLRVDVEDLSVNILRGYVPSKCIVSYKTQFLSFMLTPPNPITLPPGRDTFEILIAIYVSEAVKIPR